MRRRRRNGDERGAKIEEEEEEEDSCHNRTPKKAQVGQTHGYSKARGLQEASGEHPRRSQDACNAPLS